MRVFAIGDLHLPGGQEKPMDVFGGQWENHWPRIVSDWESRVGAGDLVLIPGDISWAMTLGEALPDLGRIDALPGRKILLRGNHDYWWGGIGRLRAALPPTLGALQNDAVRAGGLVVAGTRGWICPGAEPLQPDDRKIHLREIQRLEFSLKAARALAGQDAPLLAMTHYPPFNERRDPSGFTELMQAYGVRLALYGHLHGHSCRSAFCGVFGGVRYQLVSCDALGFRLLDVTEMLGPLA